MTLGLTGRRHQKISRIHILKNLEDYVIAKSESVWKARFSERDGPDTGYSTHYGGTSCIAVKAQKMAALTRKSGCLELESSDQCSWGVNL
ncbi:hypothetical protein AAHA92_15663 [Salvia divinorum]|uniref:Uncharacterized protein n=1 Tax=Salvia divinorum TaxID=28513 RepID=A0ABD1HG34_SALDI